MTASSQRPVERRRVSFRNGRGEMLAGRLDLPREGRPRAWALLAHCFTCTKDLKALYHLGGALAEAGIASLRVDFAGLGESEGRFEETDLTSNVGDLVAGAGYLRTVGADPSLLVGHSLGGTACLLAARELPSVKAVATMGTAADPLHLARLLPAARKTAEETGTVLVQIGPQNVRVSNRLFRELEGLDSESLVRELGRPLLVVHSAADEVVPVEQGERIFGWARHPKAFVSLTRADHVLSVASDAGSLGTLIAAWAAPYLPG